MTVITQASRLCFICSLYFEDVLCGITRKVTTKCFNTNLISSYIIHMVKRHQHGRQRYLKWKIKFSHIPNITNAPQ